MQAPELGDEDPKAPGEVLGFFSLSGALSEDTCGADSLSAPQKWSFEVKLSRDGSTLYWLNGREGIVGDIDESGSFQFETRVERALSERRGAAKGCTIVRRDIAKGSLSKASDALSLKLTYAYEQTADSECEAFVTGAEGAPQALPCRLTYSLSGARVSDE